MKLNYHQIISISFLAILISGCDKFLEEKSDKSLGTPNTLEDFKALMDDWSYLNSNFCSMGEASSDNFYLTDEDYNGLYYESDQRLYAWRPDNVSRPASSAGNEWSLCYRGIYVCNSILFGIVENNLSGPEADQVKGQALVFRAARYLDGVQVWAPVYNSQTADQDLGMVLRLDPDMNIPSLRSTVQETYDQIIADLNEAVPLLPITAVAPTLPTKAGAHGLLARAYLIMGDYSRALTEAENALTYHTELIDFNELDKDAVFPIPAINQISREVVFFTRMYSSEIVNNLNIAKIPTSLYEMYTEGDLRKDIYFRMDDTGAHVFKGTHMGHRGLITGITSSELLLIAAECNARLGNAMEAAEALNRLLIKRWDRNLFVPYSFNDPDIALTMVLEERRKELLFRGLRWSDIKRLNRDGASLVLNKVINGKQYTLPPNDVRYAIAIPEELIEITEIQQNPR
ncbi:RagB/SusD family nutrient uptake outer membrane protein [Sphingobacterium haloxyli]|uniref:RagB/SusD family nutrient uptake outer membrane protein n=1 Tax=Sphingobacterium haloxyli TaxID=2100533 RepID=A0A2S9J2A5_9SPHI|nr:RagB/SusD family nutrient uptake outer membrane protein [Sphingobacterium haloxyli]PRD46916.1 hypothetical protein C5745_12515 [Sphingobacterium haloxyli]